jgi:hypothetical protein
METESKNLSAEESLHLISSMIREAKGHIRQNSFYFLLWGWTVMLANVGMFILYQIDYRHPYIVWAITVPAWLLTMFRGFRHERHVVTRTHFDSISKGLWISYGVIIFTLVFFGWKINYQLNPLILLVTAVPTTVSGIILNFRPLVIGGVLFWVNGIIGFLLPMEFQPLVGAVAVTAGYLVPGYMLKNHD